MLGKMTLQALVAAALIGSAATVFAHDDDRDSIADTDDRVTTSTGTSQATRPDRHRENDRDHDRGRDRDRDHRGDHRGDHRR